MGSTAGAIKPNKTGEPERTPEALVEAISRSRSDISVTLEALHGVLSPRALKEEILYQVQAGKAALKADLQAEFHEAKAALATEFQDIKEQVFTGVKTEVADAKAALREATIGKVETMVLKTQDSVRGASHTLVSTVKANPIPVALVGAGLFWMFRNARAESRAAQEKGTRGAASSDRGPSFSEKLSHVAEQASSTMGNTAHSVGESLGNAASNVKESVQGAAQATSREAVHLAHVVGSAGKNAGQRAQDAFSENPLAVGAVALVAGALVGLAIPITQKETDWMGEANHKLMKQAGDLTQRVGAELHEGVENLGNELKKSIENGTSPFTSSGA